MRNIHYTLLLCMILILTIGPGLTGCASHQLKRVAYGNLYIESLPSKGC